MIWYDVVCYLLSIVILYSLLLLCFFCACIFQTGEWLEHDVSLGTFAGSPWKWQSLWSQQGQVERGAFRLRDPECGSHSSLELYGGFLKWGYPKMDGLQWFTMDNPIKMVDLGQGYPHFMESPYSYTKCTMSQTKKWYFLPQSPAPRTRTSCLYLSC